MPGWTTSHPSRAAFIADVHSIMRHGTGIQIDWTGVGAGYVDATTGKKVLPAGTTLGLLAGAGLARPRADGTNPAVGILETVAVEDNLSAPGGGMYGMIVGGNIYENLLPEASGDPRELSADVKAELQAAGTGFYFQQYEDVPSGA